MPKPSPSRRPRSKKASSQASNVIRELAQFRYNLRKFLRFSEKAARASGITPQQHQLMLGIAGFGLSGSASITELAEFLQERHHSVAELIDRASLNGLVTKEQDTVDRRVVIVSLTSQGREILGKLSALHQEELARVRDGIFMTILPPVKRQ